MIICNKTATELPIVLTGVLTLPCETREIHHCKWSECLRLVLVFTHSNDLATDHLWSITWSMKLSEIWIPDHVSVRSCFSSSTSVVCFWQIRADVMVSVAASRFGCSSLVFQGASYQLSVISYKIYSARANFVIKRNRRRDQTRC